MDWLATGSCAAAHQFGWLIGNVTGLCILAVVTVLVMTSPAYHHAVPRAVRVPVRVWSQRLLKAVPVFLLLLIWVAGGIRAQGAFLSCYAESLSFGVLVVVAPIVLLLMFTAANQVARGSVR